MEGGGGGGQTKMEKWSHTLGQGSRGVMRAAGKIVAFSAILFLFLHFSDLKRAKLMIHIYQILIKPI